MAGESHTQLALPRLDIVPNVLIVVAPYYRDVADALIAGARATLGQVGARHETIEVPGALEVPTAIRLATNCYRFQGYVALGCVIRGETSHYDIVAGESARGLMDLGLDGHCIGNGILTVDTRAQAMVRARDQDKGGGAAAACLHLIALARRFKSGGRSLGPDSPPIQIAGEPGRDRA
ncbi:MAG TPA: 6,7-dimethyl-8-ribityllumazine synthase [Paracoccaceae bacterium]|nr:6,7-dimethyl-8-ribityllumazine synthase [Paracoccaceae bacterium]